MSNRPYKCPLCHSVFRTASGTKWHIAHRHEITTAFRTLSEDYENKIANLSHDNAQLQQGLQDTERELCKTAVGSIEKSLQVIQDQIQIKQLRNEINKAKMTLAAWYTLTAKYSNAKTLDKTKDSNISET